MERSRGEPEKSAPLTDRPVAIRGTRPSAGPVRSGAVQPNDPDTADLVSMLSLTRDGADLFRGRCHAGAPLRAFGGQVAAQALTAAGRTIDAAQSPNSLHGYFLRAGDPRDLIEYRVERLHDGGTYANRRVTATQGGEAIFTLSA